MKRENEMTVPETIENNVNMEDTTAVLPEEEYSEGYVKVVLRKPVIFDGTEYKELILDLDSLKGIDLQNAEKIAEMKLRKTKQRLTIPKEADTKYTAIVAAKAAKVKSELIDSLNSQDFVTVTMAVTNFLLGGESLTETPEL